MGGKLTWSVTHAITVDAGPKRGAANKGMQRLLKLTGYCRWNTLLVLFTPFADKELGRALQEEPDGGSE